MPKVMPDLEKAVERAATGRFSRRGCFTAAAGAVLVGITAGAVKKGMEEEPEPEFPKHIISASWDGGGNEITNDYFGLQFRRYDPSKKTTVEISQLRAQPGDSVSISCYATLHGMPRYFDDIAGCAYLEGTDIVSDVATVPVSSFMRNRADNPFRTPAQPDGTVTALCGVLDLAPGVYRLVTEFYAPEPDDRDRLDFGEPGRAIARKSMPVIVGDMPYEMALTQACFATSKYFQFENLAGTGEALPEDIKASIDIFKYDGKPVQNALRWSRGRSISATLEDPMIWGQEECIMRLSVRHGDALITQSFLPITSVELGLAFNNYAWALSCPTREYVTKIQELMLR